MMIGNRLLLRWQAQLRIGLVHLIILKIKPKTRRKKQRKMNEIDKYLAEMKVLIIYLRDKSKLFTVNTPKFS